jgi:hypothetical protein
MAALATSNELRSELASKADQLALAKTVRKKGS